MLALAAAATLTAARAGESAGATPAAGDQQAQIQKLIVQLGDNDYFVRERAQTALQKIGFEAFDALSAATADEDLEIATRARYLLRLMRVDWTTKDDPAEVKKILTDYENQSAESKAARMRALADLADDAGLPALCRLVRFEKSTRLSKQAAMEIITRRAAGGPPGKPVVEAVQQNLNRCTRASAEWLRTWLLFADQPEKAMEAWTRQIETEQKLLRETPGETSATIVGAMVRFQIGWFKKHGQAEQVMAAMRRLIEIEEGDPDTIADLLDWFIKQKAYSAVDELATRFESQFKDNAVLLYWLAQSQLERGLKEKAEATAAEALKLNPGKQLEQLIAHLRTAFQLRVRGLGTWAEREYRYIIENGPATHALTMNARFGLAELLHDRGQSEDAGKQLEEVLKGQKDKPAGSELGGRSLGEIRSRMHYFFACHYQRQNDAVHQREHLLQGLDSAPPDIDLLIAVNRLADLSAEQRQKLDAAIAKWAAEIQTEIDNDPTNAIPYNQWAWLVGNTSHDVAEIERALQYSQKSLELSPDNGGYIDTLAHVYFHKGDYENAVRYQTKAVELDPHSGIIARELKRFQQKLAESKAADKAKPQ